MFNFKTGASISVKNEELICSFENQHTKTKLTEINGFEYIETFSSNIKPVHLWLTPFALGTLVTFLTPSYSIPYNLGLVLVGIAVIGFVIDILGAMLAQNWSWNIIHTFFSTEYYEVQLRGNQNWEFTFPAEQSELEKIKALKSSIFNDFISSDTTTSNHTENSTNQPKKPTEDSRAKLNELSKNANLVNGVYLTDEENLIKDLKLLSVVKGWSLWSSNYGTKKAEEAIANKATQLGSNLVYITSHTEGFGTTLKGQAYKY